MSNYYAPQCEKCHTIEVSKEWATGLEAPFIYYLLYVKYYYKH